MKTSDDIIHINLSSSALLTWLIERQYFFTMNLVHHLVMASSFFTMNSVHHLGMASPWYGIFFLVGISFLDGTVFFLDGASFFRGISFLGGVSFDELMCSSIDIVFAANENNDRLAELESGGFDITVL